MKKNIDYTQNDKRAIAAIDPENIQNTKNVKSVSNVLKTTNTKKTRNTKNTADAKDQKGKRDYNKISDPKTPTPEEYRFTIRMPGDYGRFMAELAYQRRSTITAEFTRLVKAEMKKHPEILKGLDELNF